MLMKSIKITLLFLAMCIVMSAFAQDAIHGVDGYYNWTAKQMKADNILVKGSHTFYGTTVTKNSSINYYDDYVRINTGMTSNGTTPIKFRQDVKLNFTVASPLKITKQNPVIAFKIGYPLTTNAKDFFHTFEIFWKFKIKDGDTIKVRTSGTYQNAMVNSSINATAFPYYKKNGNGTGTFGYGSWKTSPIGRFDFLAGGTNSWKTIDGVYQYFFNKDCAIGDSVNTASTKSSTITGFFKANNDTVSWNLFYVNFKQVVDSVGDIEIFNFANQLGDMVTDTTKLVILRNEAGDSIGKQNVSKTRSELPYYNIKWIKTFPSLAALKAQSTVNYGDGNDNRSDNQLILNAALYYAKKTLQNYAYSDAKYRDPYQAAFDVALTIYQSTSPSVDKTSAEWIAWDANVAKAVSDLTTAKTNFLKGISAKLANPYNVIKTGNGEAEFVLGETKTLKTGVKGKLLVLGGQGSGTPFLITKSSSTIGGRTAYTLSNSAGKVCLSSDTLIFVENANLSTASTPVLFVFSNRSDDDYPAFDIFVNNKFLYVNKTTGKLTTITDIPDGEIQDLGAYLFDIVPAVYDASNDNPNVQLFQGWEFENGSTDNVERNTWRMYSLVENKVIGNKGCLAFSIAPTYYTAQDSLHTTLLTIDFSTGTVAGGYRRESGTYPNSAKLNPSKRDSSLIIYTNTFKKRYLAIKMAGTNPALKATIVSFATDQQVIDMPLADTVAVKGDVYIWDMLKQGVAYGNIGWPSQYITVGNFTSATEKAYIDWIRPYASVTEIPNEILDVHTGIFNPSNDNNIRILTNQQTITVNAEKPSDISIYTINGIRIANQFTTKLIFDVNNKGVYIVSVRDNNRVISEKAVVH